MFHRLDQPANHAGGLGARVEVDAFFSLVLFEGSVVENGGARYDCVSGFLFFFVLKNLRGSFLYQFPFGSFTSHLSYFQVCSDLEPTMRILSLSKNTHRVLRDNQSRA